MPLPELKTPARAAPGRIEKALVSEVLHDPALCAMPGLFRYAKGSERALTRTGLQLKYDFGDKWTLEVHCSTILNGEDMAVLQAITGLATTSHDVITPSPDKSLHGIAQELTTAIQPPANETHEVQQVSDKLVHVDFSASNLLDIIGWADCGPNRVLVRECVQRLSTVVLLVYPPDNPKAWQRTYLISTVQTNADSNKWTRTHIAINPRLSKVILGDIASSTKISLAESRLLGTDQVARLLHQRLSFQISPNSAGEISYKKLLGYVWPDDPEQQEYDAVLRMKKPSKYGRKKPETLRRERLAEVRAALVLIEETLPGWKVELATEVPYVENKYLAKDEQEAARLKHENTVQSRLTKAALDEMETILSITRPRISKQ